MILFEPHGWCLLWDWRLIVPMVVSDSFIAFAYFAIPCALVRYIYTNPSVRMNPLLTRVLWAFAGFISLCGLTHLTDIFTIWYPVYYLAVYVRIATAFASLATAILIWPALPILFPRHPRAKADH